MSTYTIKSQFACTATLEVLVIPIAIVAESVHVGKSGKAARRGANNATVERGQWCICGHRIDIALCLPWCSSWAVVVGFRVVGELAWHWSVVKANGDVQGHVMSV